MWRRFHVRYPLFCSDFNKTWIFWTDFRKSIKYQIQSKSVQWEPSCSTRTDRNARRTDGHDKANSRFSQSFKWNVFLPSSSTVPQSTNHLKCTGYSVLPAASSCNIMVTLHTTCCVLIKLCDVSDSVLYIPCDRKTTSPSRHHWMTRFAN